MKSSAKAGITGRMESLIWSDGRSDTHFLQDWTSQSFPSPDFWLLLSSLPSHVAHYIPAGVSSLQEVCCTVDPGDESCTGSECRDDAGQEKWAQESVTPVSTESRCQSPAEVGREEADCGTADDSCA